MSRQIPLTFHPDNPELFKREMDTLASSLQAYFATLTGPQHAATVQRRMQSLPLNSTKAAFGFWTPVSLVNDSDVHTISLPPPDPRNAGLVAAVVRKATPGTIKLSAPDALVNGFEVVELPNAVGRYELLFDGENYYADGGATWSEG